MLLKVLFYEKNKKRKTIIRKRNKFFWRVFKNKETKEIERTVYYHTVLEAKLIVGNMALSILTEFVENEDEDVSKQDCEIEVAKRLFKKFKFKFRKLNICVLGNSLYACKPIYRLCNEFNWKYI